MEVAGVGAPEGEVPVCFSLAGVPEGRVPGGPETLGEQLTYVVKKQNRAGARLNRISELGGAALHGRLEEKAGVRVLSLPESEAVRRDRPDRTMGSRWVRTWKEGDGRARRAKSRRVLSGHDDPHTTQLAEAGEPQAPTISQTAKMTFFQFVAARGWRLQMSDVGTAFLNSPLLARSGGELYASPPRDTGLPGAHEDQLVEVLRNVYGLNRAPGAWHETLRAALLEPRCEASVMDPCPHVLRDKTSGRTVGTLIVCVDDLALA